MERFIHHGKRIARIVSGFVLIVAGLIMSIPGVPGPGLLVVFAGLSILAIDFVWAHRLKTKIHEKSKSLIDKVRKKPTEESKKA